MSLKKKLEKLRSIYKRIPRLKGCKKCGNCCGSTYFMRIERINLNRFLAKNKIKKKKMFSLLDFIKNPDLRCPYYDLENKLCKVYPARPILCRLFGVVDKKRMKADLRCPNGAIPSYLLTEKEANRLLKEVESI